jgi:uncharacterized protein (DUF4415 family)
VQLRSTPHSFEPNICIRALGFKSIALRFKEARDKLHKSEELFERAAAESASSIGIDPDDAPELTQEMIERADLYHGDKLIRRGRPPSDNPKQALKLRIDPDVVEHFRETGPGWQTRINDTLRRAAKLPKRKAG